MESPIGYVPAPGAIDLTGLDVTERDMAELLRVDPQEWQREIPLIEEHFATFGDRLPPELLKSLEELRDRLGA